MNKEKKDAEVLKEVIERTPREINVCDLIGLDEDDEDRYIYERRMRERGY